MKIVIFMFCLLLSGCASTNCDVQQTLVPVYTVPNVEMPIRPILRSSEESKFPGEISRNAELDMMDLKTYAIQLESILQKLKNQ